jgi:hypothetical protein
VPAIKHQQGSAPTCAIPSAASAIHTFGDERAAMVLAIFLGLVTTCFHQLLLYFEQLHFCKMPI